jgi:hypothetical protein
MKRKSFLLIVLITGMAALFLAGSLTAGTTIDDEIIMENKIYEKRKYNPVPFTHKNHIEKHQITCGECHHDENGKPLADLKEGDDVKSCAECHKKPGKKKNKSWTDQQKREYHANALHDNCINCHVAYNLEKTGKKNKPAPKSCKKCHIGGKLK